MGPTLVGPSNNSVIQAYVRPGTGAIVGYNIPGVMPLRDGRYIQIDRPAETGLTENRQS